MCVCVCAYASVYVCVCECACMLSCVCVHSFLFFSSNSTLLEHRVTAQFYSVQHRWLYNIQSLLLITATRRPEARWMQGAAIMWFHWWGNYRLVIRETSTKLHLGRNHNLVLTIDGQLSLFTPLIVPWLKDHFLSVKICLWSLSMLPKRVRYSWRWPILTPNLTRVSEKVTFFNRKRVRGRGSR